jgi:N-acetylneuraminate synthase
MAEQKLLLGDTIIGDGQPIYFIAEIGINHNGSIDIAKRLIDSAFACRWHCIKLQKRTPELCVPEHQKTLARETPWGNMTYLEYKHKVEFGSKEYFYLDRYCREKPIHWAASVWDLPSLEFILSFDVPFIKIASAKLTDHELIKATACCGKPVILSTGMSSVEEIDAAVNILEKYIGGQYVLMHTNSTYPTPATDLNLRVILLLKNRYHCIVGYSGHEYDLEPSVLAVSLGARVIERHITVDHNMWGSDQAASLEVNAMDKLLKRTRDVDVILGDGIKQVTAKEMEIRKKLRG